MTPDEMGKALGDGWERHAGWLGGPGSWEAFDETDRAGVIVTDPSEATELWVVTLMDAESDEAALPCVSAEAAVAVAHLLVAAEQIAGGAEVKAERWWHVFAFAPSSVHKGLVGWAANAIWPAEARRFALDLLRAAAEAEEQG